MHRVQITKDDPLYFRPCLYVFCGYAYTVGIQVRHPCGWLILYAPFWGILYIHMVPSWGRKLFRGYVALLWDRTSLLGIVPFYGTKHVLGMGPSNGTEHVLGTVTSFVTEHVLGMVPSYGTEHVLVTVPSFATEHILFTVPFYATEHVLVTVPSYATEHVLILY